uniref:Hva1_TUDOR domain-containing protein n=1 Tax=Heterorhabditis bacteriophora TaxID=37862 RepID=A0A1I7XS67_HETBA
MDGGRIASRRASSDLLVFLWSKKGKPLSIYVDKITELGGVRNEQYAIGRIAWVKKDGSNQASANKEETRRRNGVKQTSKENL